MDLHFQSLMVATCLAGLVWFVAWIKALKRKAVQSDIEKIKKDAYQATSVPLPDLVELANKRKRGTRHDT